jgi:hypothetical protein
MKLAGALLWMVIAASVLTVVSVTGFILAFDRLRELGLKYQIAVTFITLWSIAFVAMTLLRLRPTPIVASCGLVIWIAYRLAVALLTAGWPLAVDLLGEAVLVAGFCGYMAAGAAPNAYYRRRLPSP